MPGLTPWTWPDAWKLRAKLVLAALREHLLFDSGLAKTLIGIVGQLVGYLLLVSGRHRAGFTILAKVHRAALSYWGTAYTEDQIHASYRAFQEGKPHPLHQVYADYVDQLAPTPQTRKFFEAPQKLFPGAALVLKSPAAHERGVIILQYSYVYPLLAKFYDLQRIAQRYYLALEPSWSGFCDLNVLIYTRLQHPVFVGSIEPRDTEFLRRLNTNLIPVPFSSNTWVDHRVFRPLPEVRKDADIIMVAGWAGYKRHYAFFRGLRRLRERYPQPKVILVGYPIDLTQDDILRQADLCQVRDLLEIHEWAAPAEVNRLMNRAKVNVLWSRREGVNRAIIEGMLAGLPCLVREGMNYGFRYPHINAQTGRFAPERELPQHLREMIEQHDRFSPRAWVLANMSSQRTTALLNEAIKAQALALGEKWTIDIVAKINELGCVRYWDAADENRFAADYEFLRSCIVNNFVDRAASVGL
jgi:glycosyltransferase involved in cell wall biosynthesis